MGTYCTAFVYKNHSHAGKALLTSTQTLSLEIFFTQWKAEGKTDSGGSGELRGKLMPLAVHQPPRPSLSLYVHLSSPLTFQGRGQANNSSGRNTLLLSHQHTGEIAEKGKSQQPVFKIGYFTGNSEFLCQKFRR